MLDRIIRGRAWIPLLGVLLAGIVAMQVEVLKLNASMGRTLERGTQLQSLNEQLRTNVAWLGDDQRIERRAAAMGMVMPTPAAINFLPSRSGGDVQRALKSIHPPDAAGFVASLPAIDTAAAAPGTPATPATSDSSSTTPGAATPTGG